MPAGPARSYRDESQPQEQVKPGAEDMPDPCMRPCHDVSCHRPIMLCAASHPWPDRFSGSYRFATAGERGQYSSNSKTSDEHTGKVLLIT